MAEAKIWQFRAREQDERIVEAERRRLQADRPYAEISRTEAIRSLLYRASTIAAKPSMPPTTNTIEREDTAA